MFSMLMPAHALTVAPASFRAEFTRAPKQTRSREALELYQTLLPVLDQRAPPERAANAHMNFAIALMNA